MSVARAVVFRRAGANTNAAVKLFLCGDVMIGRGIDQILPHSCPPAIYETYAKSALDYVELAERASGPIPRMVEPDYVWGDALRVLEGEGPDARIINLETSVTTSEHPEPKGINYRMHPGNLPVLTAAGIDCCALANNHVLDWGEAGLVDTLDALERAGIAVAGAGLDTERARAPAVIATGVGHRVLVFSIGLQDSGIPPSWSATRDNPGVFFVPDLSARSIDELAAVIEPTKRPNDLTVLSVHWGENWGYDIPADQRRFAHALIDRELVDVVHGHSSHHPKAVEVHRGRPILYGCGDFLNDYEGITGYERFRDDLVLMYFVTFDVGQGRLARLEMIPFQIHGFRLREPSDAHREWLARRMDRECRRFGHAVRVEGERLALDL